jgi:hypothetical protein
MTVATGAATSSSSTKPCDCFTAQPTIILLHTTMLGYSVRRWGTRLSGAAVCSCRNPPLPCFPVSQFPSISALSRPVRGGSRPRPLHELATRLHIHVWLYRSHHTARCVLIGSVVGTFESIDADPMEAASGLLDWYSKPGAVIGPVVVVVARDATGSVPRAMLVAVEHPVARAEPVPHLGPLRAVR